MKKNNEVKMHSVKYNFIMNCILKMSAFIFPVITFPYISRVLGADGNGKISFATSVVYYFTTIASLGIPTYGIRVCAQCRDDKEKLSRTVHELLMISSFTAAFSYLFMSASIYMVPKFGENMEIIVISSASLLLTSIGVEWFYQAIEQYDYITYRNIAFKILSIVLMFAFVKDANDYLIYGGINVLGTVGSNILNLLRIKKYILITPVGKYHIRKHLRPIVAFSLFTIAITIYTNLDTVMLGLMTNDSQVGYYNAAIKMKGILLSVVTALGTVLLPRVSYYIEKGLEKEFSLIIKKSFQFVIAISVPLVLYFVIESQDTISLLAGNGYAKAVVPMMIITPTIFFIGLSNVTGIQILVPLGLEKYTIISTIYGAVVDLILNIIFIPLYGAAGAAIGTLIAELIVLVVQLIYLRKNSHLNVDYRDAIKVLIVSGVAAIVLVGFKALVSLNSSFLSLVVTSIIFFGIYGVGLILIKEDIVIQYVIKNIKSRHNRK